MFFIRTDTFVDDINLNDIISVFCQVPGGAASSDLSPIRVFPHTRWARQDHGVETDCKRRNRFKPFVINKNHDAGNKRVAHWLHAVTFTLMTSDQLCTSAFPSLMIDDGYSLTEREVQASFAAADWLKQRGGGSKLDQQSFRFFAWCPSSDYRDVQTQRCRASDGIR